MILDSLDSVGEETRMENGVTFKFLCSAFYHYNSFIMSMIYKLISQQQGALSDIQILPQNADTVNIQVFIRMISGHNMIEINEVQSSFKSLTHVELLIRVCRDTSNHH